MTKTEHYVVITTGHGYQGGRSEQRFSLTDSNKMIFFDNYIEIVLAEEKERRRKVFSDSSVRYWDVAVKKHTIRFPFSNLVSVEEFYEEVEEEPEPEPVVVEETGDWTDQL